MAKNIYIYFKFCFLYKWKCGAVVESQTGNPEIAGSSPPVLFSFLNALHAQSKELGRGPSGIVSTFWRKVSPCRCSGPTKKYVLQ